MKILSAVKIIGAGGILSPDRLPRQRCALPGTALCSLLSPQRGE
jgi:hypothetical protein